MVAVPKPDPVSPEAREPVVAPVPEFVKVPCNFANSLSASGSLMRPVADEEEPELPDLPLKYPVSVEPEPALPAGCELVSGEPV